MDNLFSIKGHWSAGELAKAAGVSTDTLRHYERKGVLQRPSRASNGYRRYPADALERVLLIRRALTVGLTLAELALILAERDRGGSPCKEVRRLVAEKLEGVEEQLIAIAALRDELRSTLNDWDKRLSATKANEQAHLLDTLQTTRVDTKSGMPQRPKQTKNHLQNQNIKEG